MKYDYAHLTLTNTKVEYKLYIWITINERRILDGVCADYGRHCMVFSYNKLWKLLIDRHMMKKDLMAKTSITSTTMAKMSKGLPVSMEVLGRICKALNVNVGDIVDYVDENPNKKND